MMLFGPGVNAMTKANDTSARKTSSGITFLRARG
jgi:hypothetical protein